MIRANGNRSAGRSWLSRLRALGREALPLFAKHEREQLAVLPDVDGLRCFDAVAGDGDLLRRSSVQDDSEMIITVESFIVGRVFQQQLVVVVGHPDLRCHSLPAGLVEHTEHYLYTSGR